MLLPHDLCRPWKALLLGATVICLLTGGGQSEAACTEPPVTGLEEAPAVTGRTLAWIELRNHDRCSGKVDTVFSTSRDLACRESPLIGRPVWIPDRGLPPLHPAKSITHDSIEIEYNNRCPAARSTRVTIGEASSGRITTVQEDGARVGGWRTALARNLEPDTFYEITVLVSGTDGRVRESSRTFRTHPDPNPARTAMQARVIARSVE